jgi:release factor glutamine methyltransferase
MQATIQYIRTELQSSHSEEEIRELIKQIFWGVRGYSLTDIYLRREESLTADEQNRIAQMVGRLKNQEPIQYILGKTEFCGLPLRVNHHVLIPRPETEELVQWAIAEQKTPPSSILDIGCGSGCIALAMKKAFPSSIVSGCDISSGALEIARENAILNHLEVAFWEADILNREAFQGWKQTELIISNPPYVTIGEKKWMKRNVLDYEPHQALFVPDEDPLHFYRQIAEFAGKWLCRKGTLYFEINEHFGAEMTQLLDQMNFSEIVVRKDFRGNERMVRAIK